MNKQETAENSHDFEDRSSGLEVMLTNGNKTINNAVNINLNPDSIIGFAPKGFDTEVLLNPFEVQINLPAIAVNQDDTLDRKEVVTCVVDEEPF